MTDNLLFCKACKKELHNTVLNDYSFCAYCGSANYISEKNAEEDNAIYFDAIYALENNYIDTRRMKLFQYCCSIHDRFYRKEAVKFGKTLRRISELIIGANKVVEIGFGSGDEMIKNLRANVDIYGLDLSREAVDNFQSKYPEYIDRVRCSAQYDFSVNIVYSNALFEHLDDPDTFLSNVASMLKNGGNLIMRLPLIVDNINSKRKLTNDINFWKPCHRVLYTLSGINTLLRKHGFKISEAASHAYYGYKVLSKLLELGYKEVNYYRSPYLKSDSIDSDLRYISILIQSFFNELICQEFALILHKE
jgi:SAM-dependent methyltransferase